MRNYGWVRVSLFSAGLLAFGGFAANVHAQKATQEPTAIVENRELDRQRVEAFNTKDVEQLMMFRWNSPDLVDVFPDGTVYRGWDNVRQGLEQFFAGLESVRLEVTEVSYIRSADGVLAVGTYTVQLQPKDGPLQQMTARWTDFRRKHGGNWVIVYEHTHALPLAER